LLGLALSRAGIPATVLNTEQAQLSTRGATLDADLISLDKARVLAALEAGVVVLPGFVGRGENGETTLLGRGGSDLTALFLSHQLRGECRLIKDVNGLYTTDPNSKTGRHANRFAQISYDTARRIGGAVVQLKAIDFAEKQRLRFTISQVGSHVATEVGTGFDLIETNAVETVDEVEECVA
jgi:homoserine dehydrogenase